MDQKVGGEMYHVSASIVIYCITLLTKRDRGSLSEWTSISNPANQINQILPNLRCLNQGNITVTR